MINKIRNGFKNSKGLTLVELLVAIGVTITAATVVVAIITASFKTTSQIGTSEDLRQSGNTALSQVSKTIQFADHFESVVSGGVITTVCKVSNSPTYEKINIISDGKEKTISCLDNSGDPSNLNLEADSESIPFIDSGKVTINSCSIICTQSSSSEPPLIRVELDLSSVSQESSNIHLVRNIKMRNL